MKKLLAGGIVLCLALLMFLALNRRTDIQAAEGAGGPMIAHNVYFSLNDNSAEAKKKLVAACKKYLSKHEGTAFFAAGVRADEFDRPINDRDFDVGLHIVFKTKAAHDKYQDAAMHKRFIAENKDNWKKVRVFDSQVEQ